MAVLSLLRFGELARWRNVLGVRPPFPVRQRAHPGLIAGIRLPTWVSNIVLFLLVGMCAFLWSVTASLIHSAFVHFSLPSHHLVEIMAAAPVAGSATLLAVVAVRAVVTSERVLYRIAARRIEQVHVSDTLPAWTATHLGFRSAPHLLVQAGLTPGQLECFDVLVDDFDGTVTELLHIVRMI